MTTEEYCKKLKVSATFVIPVPEPTRDPALPDADQDVQHDAELEQTILVHEANLTLQTLSFSSASQRLACIREHACSLGVWSSDCATTSKKE
jgi:hypothetical protein